jgi:hypothetical protein
MNVDNPTTGMSHEEMKGFIRNHFEEFVNRKNLNIADLNFDSDFVDHGADVSPGTPPGPAGARRPRKRPPLAHVARTLRPGSIIVKLPME